MGVGETYISAFALAYGFSERFAGLVSVLPIGLASIVQLISGRFLIFFKSRRGFIVTCAILQAISLLLLVFRAPFPNGAQEGLLVILFSYWLFGLSAGPVWNAWIVALVPTESRLRFFSTRGKVHELSLLVGVLLGGGLLYITEGSLRTFMILFFFAGIFRLISAYALFQHPDESQLVLYKSSYDFGNFLKWLKSKKVMGILFFLGLFNFGVSIGSPYFSPFLLKKLEISYSCYMLILAIPLLSRAFSYSFHEKSVQKWGIKSTLFFCSVIIALMPIFWARYPSLYVIIFLQILAGWAWAGFEYCILLSQIEDFDQQERSRVLIWSNFIVGVCNIFGVLIGSSFLSRYPDFDSYISLFTLSSFFRFLPLVILLTVRWSTVLHARKIMVRVLGILPNRGAISRPILYLDDKDKNEK